jgi:hypothetical protein
MKSMSEGHDRRRELAYRATDGLEVSLLWDPRDDGLIVSVVDTKDGRVFELGADGENALDVFYHPYAHEAAITTSLSAEDSAPQTSPGLPRS